MIRRQYPLFKEIDFDEFTGQDFSNPYKKISLSTAEIYYGPVNASDQPDGQGVSVTYYPGSVKMEIYIGEFANGKKHGHGKLFNPLLRHIKEGEWMESELHSTEYDYWGDFRLKRHYEEPDGCVITDIENCRMALNPQIEDIKDIIRHGQGECTYPRKANFKGIFDNDSRVRGQILSDDGKIIYEGRFINDEPIIDDPPTIIIRHTD